MASTIFSGNNIKTLKPNLDLFGAAQILTGTVDPSSSATSATAGSLYLNTSSGNLYRKTDAGSSTNWKLVAFQNGADINETSFAAANNQSSVANVTGLAFANATVRAAEIILSVYVNATSSLYEFFTINVIQKGAAWDIAATSVGDVSGFTFTITNAGQIQYTNSNYTGFTAATVKFRAYTVSV